MTMEGKFEILKPQNPWARISEIAAKVGVKPIDVNQPTITAMGADGNFYDVWEVLARVLDKLEKIP